MVKVVAKETSFAAVAEDIGPVRGMRTVKTVEGPYAERPVVATLAECLEGKGDYYHPEFGWLRAKGKMEKDPAIDDRDWVGRVLS